MPGSFDLDGSSPPLAAPALSVYVARYDGIANYAVLPNVRCLRIDYREGPEPPIARFAYVQDDELNRVFGWPSRLEDLWPLDAMGPYVVGADDRVVALAQNPDGSVQVFFDGFAQVPQADVSPQTERVTFAAVGVAARAWDYPIIGRVERDADSPKISSGEFDVRTDLPARFNPADQRPGAMGGILGNSTPNANATINNEIGNYPVFIEPLLIERESITGDDLVAPWYIADALKYLLAVEAGEEEWVRWPNFATLDQLLNAKYPPPGSDVFNPATAVSANVMIRDYDAANKPLPEVLADFLGYAGFLTAWQTTTDSDGLPVTYLRLYRRDAAATGTPKPVYLPAADRTAVADASTANVAQLHLVRDCNSIANVWQVETAQRQVEITVVLAPLFQPSLGDERATSDPTTGRGQFKKTNLTNAPTDARRKYRWYGADECGDGHWDAVNTSVIHSAVDLRPVFPDDEDGNATYATRYRPGSQTLVSRDPQGHPKKATLEILMGAISTDPSLPTEPASSNWLTISHGWRLLEDRLGIEVTVEDPEDWSTGNPKLPKINGITWQANPPDGKQFTLRLTTVIEDDRGLDIAAEKRVASPTRFVRTRVADARDHFQYAEVSLNSLNYQAAGGNGTDPVKVRDDTQLALDHAKGLRSVHEFPLLAGSITIPYVTTYYEIGDRVQAIKGRDVSLRTNVGASAGEAAVYPWIVGISWSFEPVQTTTLLLSDRRAERQNP
jgi:hypothetical protein